MQPYTFLPSSLSSDPYERIARLPHASFEDWVDRHPREIALVTESETLTYAEVEQRANRIAHALHSAGVQKGEIVAILLDRTPELIFALLGVLKAGAAFTLLDPRLPKETLARSLSTVARSHLLTQRSAMTHLPLLAARPLYLDDTTWLQHPVQRPQAVAGPDDPACVLFTSGSTGRPKAVLYLQRNLAERSSNTREMCDFIPSNVFAQSSSVTSIDAIDEILIPLTHGGCTAILPYSTVTDPHQLVDALAAGQVTHMLLVPSLLRMILSAEENLDQRLPSLRTWMIGGEPLTAPLVRQFYEQLPAAVLINWYGLTEGDGTYHLTSPAVKYDRGVPIGTPMPGTRVYLLDDCLHPVSNGESGEICLAGQGLSHQYLNDPDLNAERWIANPFETEGPYARVFRTGDLGRMRPDGSIEYLGRRDRMVKVRGFRVELGDVELVMGQHPSVEQCVAITRHPGEKPSDDRHLHPASLVMHVVLKKSAAADPQSLREFLKDRLPDFAVPTLIFIHNALPLSSTGKVDLQSLAQFEPAEREDCSGYLPARNPLELRLTQIWESVLDFRPIGVTDNFFAIGGDSLRAIDLMLTLEKEFRCRLPITALIQYPTISALAGLLRGEGNQVARDSLVPIRAHGSRPPLFCIHADGSVFIYRRFVEYLDADIPVYGLQAHGLANPRDRLYTQIDEMAGHYLREIQTVQAQGPYHLCAFSAGGLIIYEMARQLRARGQEVAFLGLLDAYGPDYPEYLPGKSVAEYKVSVHLNTLRLHGGQERMQYLLRRARHRADTLLSRVFAPLLLKLHLPLPGKIHYEYVARSVDRAARLYPPGRTYAGSAVLFRALTQPDGVQPDPTLGWSKLIQGGLKSVDTVGTHHSIMRHEPHIAELVRQIDCYLGELHNRPLIEQSTPGRASR